MEKMNFQSEVEVQLEISDRDWYFPCKFEFTSSKCPQFYFEEDQTIRPDWMFKVKIDLFCPNNSAFRFSRRRSETFATDFASSIYSVFEKYFQMCGWTDQI